MSADTTTPPAGRLERMVASYREDHRDPINHILHVYVGWPLCALGVILAPFWPWSLLVGFGLGYAFMWTGHFVFEKNIPTVFKHPTTPFVIAWAVILGMAAAVARVVSPSTRRAEVEPPRS
jgi:hypothetical protein